MHKYGQFDHICEINGNQVGHVRCSSGWATSHVHFVPHAVSWACEWLASGCGYHVLLCPLTAVSWACGGWVWLPCIAVSPYCSLLGMRWVGVATMYCCVLSLQSPGHAVGGCGYHVLLCPLTAVSRACGGWVWRSCIAVSSHCSLPGMRWVGVATMYCCVLSLQSPGHAVGGCGCHVLLCPLTAVSWACGGWVWRSCIAVSSHCSLPGMRVVNVYDIDQKTYLIKLAK